MTKKQRQHRQQYEGARLLIKEQRDQRRVTDASNRAHHIGAIVTELPVSRNAVLATRRLAARTLP